MGNIRDKIRHIINDGMVLIALFLHKTPQTCIQMYLELQNTQPDATPPPKKHRNKYGFTENYIHTDVVF